MRITISGTAGAGKSTIARLVAKKLKLKHYSMGDFTRMLAKKKGLSILEFSRLQEKDRTVDIDIDRLQRELGKKDDNFIIDSRLGFHFIPHADLKVFLDAELETRAKRILKDNRKDEKAGSLKKTVQSMKRREKSEKMRYKKYYGLDPWNKRHYGMVIDTTDLGVEEIAKIVINKAKTTKR